MTSDEMSQLFDIDLDSNLEPTDNSSTDDWGSSNKNQRSFDSKCEDVDSVLEKEVISDEKIINNAFKQINKQTVVVEETEDTILDELDLDEIESEIDDDLNSIIIQTKEKEEVQLPEKIEAPKNVSEENPLELFGSDLKAFDQIKIKWPQFSLYDGNRSFKDFYKLKLSALKGLLTKFPLLDVQKLYDEITSVELGHFLGDDIATPDIIRIKIDNCQRQRVRVCHLLLGALGQFYAWERSCTLLRSKLWKDHDIKGTHRREGLALEHLFDIETYVASMKGFIEQAKQADTVLKAASDSLSRQLTCLQIKEPTGFVNMHEHEYKHKHKVEREVEQDQEIENSHDSSLENWDTITEGHLISPPIKKGNSAAQEVNFIVGDDISELG